MTQLGKIWVLVVAALASVAVAGCGQAATATVDASRDVDCSVVAFYFKRLAEERSAEAAQLRSISKVHDWYAVKVQALARKEGAAAVLNLGGPILDEVKRNPTSMKNVLVACTNRALGEGLR